MNRFEEMLALASKENQTISGEYAQTVVGLTENGRLFSLPLCNALETPSAEIETFLSLLLENGNRALTHLVCLWKRGDVDLPSFALRKSLIEQNPENGKASILLVGENGYTQRTLKSTML